MSRSYGFLWYQSRKYLRKNRRRRKKGLAREIARKEPTLGKDGPEKRQFAEVLAKMSKTKNANEKRDGSDNGGSVSQSFSRSTFSRTAIQFSVSYSLINPAKH